MSVIGGLSTLASGLSCEGIRPQQRVDTPPILPPYTYDDSTKVGGSDAENSAFMYLALKRVGIPVELHIYANSNHDFGVRQNKKLPQAGPSFASTGCAAWT